MKQNSKEFKEHLKKIGFKKGEKENGNDNTKESKYKFWDSYKKGFERIKMVMKIKNRQFVNNKKFKRDDLIHALLNYKPHKNKSGKDNSNYKNGKGEKYVRIRVNGMKVKRSHIVWMIWNKKSHIPKGKIIHHKNGNKRDDYITNLELKDAIDHGKLNLKNNINVLNKKDGIK